MAKVKGLSMRSSVAKAYLTAWFMGAAARNVETRFMLLSFGEREVLA